MAVLTGVATNRNTGAVYVSGTFDTGTYIGESEVQLPSPREGATNVLVAKWGQDRHDPNGDQSSFGGKGRLLRILVWFMNLALVIFSIVDRQ